MSLRETQDALARLFTDPDYRNEWADDPADAKSESGLDDRDAEVLASVAGNEGRYFSDSLVRKRAHEVAKLLPITRTHMGADFEPAFGQFAATFNPDGVRRHLEDALAFCRFVEAGDGAYSDETKIAARYEAAKLDFFANDRVLRFSTSVPRSTGSARFFAVWFRLAGRVYHRSL